jgi:hypothetical protein
VTASRVVLETEDFVAAARLLHLWVADPLRTSVTTLSNALAGCGAMAGSDPGGLAWAAAYDGAAVSALNAAADAVNAVDKLAAMFAQTARNYASADAASTPAGAVLLDSAVASLPRFGDPYWLPVCMPPSAAGGGGGAPAGWALVERLVGYVWPDGHQDRLRGAARAWSASAAALDHGAGDAVSAAQLAIADRLPEADDMWAVTSAMGRQLSAVADVHCAMSAACTELAAHLDAAHAAVAGELVNLIEWTAGIEVAGGLLSVVTFGLAEAPTQAAEGARVAASAARIAQLIERFIGLARIAAQPLAAALERADRVAAELSGVNGVRLTTAVVTQVRLAPTTLRLQEMMATRRLGVLATGDRPALTFTAAQVQRKFKHAAAFGVTLARGRTGFMAFQDAIEAFVTAPNIRTVVVTYRGRDVLLSYDAVTRVAVMQELDGTFVSGWKLTHIQFLHAIRDRRLGGG